MSLLHGRSKTAWHATGVSCNCQNFLCGPLLVRRSCKRWASLVPVRSAGLKASLMIPCFLQSLLSGQTLRATRVASAYGSLQSRPRAVRTRRRNPSLDLSLNLQADVQAVSMSEPTAQALDLILETFKVSDEEALLVMKLQA